jgi:hypothetical protein
MSASPRFVKVSAGGELLPRSAEDWAGVYIPAAELIVARSPTPKAYTFKGAQAACREVDLCGAKAERSISLVEFVTHLLDNGRYRPVIDPDFFTLDDPATWIWTCDECQPAGYARGVYLGFGDSLWFHQDYRVQALAVRASQLSAFGAAA